MVLTNIDVNGKESLEKNNIPLLSIFLVPDNIERLKERIIKRGGVDDAEAEKRIKAANKEIEMAGQYDYRVVNAEGKLDETVAKVAKILEEQLKLDKYRFIR